MGEAVVHAQERNGDLDSRREAGRDSDSAAGESDAGAENGSEVDGLGAHVLHDFGDVVFLKEANGGDAGGSGFEAGVGIL